MTEGGPDRPRRVLVVDASAGWRRSLAGCIVEKAPALVVDTAATADAVVVDLALDGGPALVEGWLGQRAPPALIVLQSVSLAGSVDLMNRGVEDVLDKSGLQPAALCRALLHALARHQRRRALERALRSAHQQACRDPLTGLWNRRGLAGALALERRGPWWALLLDLDHFKQVNERRGHHAGDALLAAMGQGLLGALHRRELAARIGGDEVLVVFPAPDEVAAQAVGQRLRAGALAAMQAVEGAEELGPLGMSGGLVPLPPDRRSLGAVLPAATAALHQAKGAGRGCICPGSCVAPEGADDAAISVQRRALIATDTGRVEGWELHGRAGALPLSIQLAQARAEGAVDALDLRLLRARLAAARMLPRGGVVLLPLLGGTLETTAARGALLDAARRLPQHRFTAVVWGPVPRPAALGAPVAALRAGGVEVGVGRLGRGRTPVELLVTLAPTLVRLDDRVLRAEACPADLGGAVAQLAHLGRSLGARVVAPLPRRPVGAELRQRLGALGVDLCAAR